MKSNFIFLGATGAVGTQVSQTLLNEKAGEMALLGRRTMPNFEKTNVTQHVVDVFDPNTYRQHLSNKNIAICTLGVGQPSKMSKEEFLKIDKTAVLDFAKVCKEAGVQEFHLLSSVGINAKSFNYYLRAKGELVEELNNLDFNRLSIYKPSMILTPENRYGFGQALTLKVWPVISHMLVGGLKKYKGIKVGDLGKSIALNAIKKGKGYEELEWPEFQKILA